MAPQVDWDRLMRVDPDSMGEDESDMMYEMLSKAEGSGELNESPERLIHLFKVTQAIMNEKAEESKVLMEELETDAKSKQENEDQIQALKDEVKELKRYGGGGAGGGSAADNTRYLREEIREFERQVDELQEQLKEMDRELSKEKTARERMESRAEEAETNAKEIRREVERLREDNRDYQNQLDSQRETLMMRRGDDVENRDKMRGKNRLIAEQLEEIQNLTDANDELQKQADQMRKNLEESVADMDRMTEEYMKMKMLVQQSDILMDQKIREADTLREQVVDLTTQLHARSEDDDQVMAALGTKVEEWKQALADKDGELFEAQGMIRELRAQIRAAEMDSDKQSIAAMTQALKERDQQIAQLKEQLETAVSEMETNAARMEDLEKDQRGTKGKPSLVQQNRIKDLQSTLTKKDEVARNAEERMIQAEEDAREKDKQLTEALTRMREYEQGEYGLAEAVQEIKAHKTQLKVRERSIEELTQHINKIELEMNDLWDENEDLRERLGLDAKEPLDISQFRNKKNMRNERYRAENQVLMKEVERLEEERIELKQQVRRLAQEKGHRAVEMGLTAADLTAIQDFKEQLKRKNQGISEKNQLLGDPQVQELKIKVEQLDKDQEQNEERLQQAKTEVTEFKSRCKELMAENKQLEKGMKEILDAIKESQTGPQEKKEVFLRCPTLEHMLTALDTRAKEGKYDSSLHFKAQVDQLTGRNDELRSEMREARNEAAQARSALEKAETKIQKLEQEIQNLRVSGGKGVSIQPLPLPEGMVPSSADVIATLNEYLVQILHELSQKEDLLQKLEGSLEDYRRKYSVMRHQQGLVYTDFKEQREEFNQEKEKLKEEIRKVADLREQDGVRIQEYTRLLDTLEMAPDEQQRRLAEMTRKMTVLRVNEKSLTRRYTTLEEMETSLRKENTRLKNDIIAMEKSVAERIGYLQRYKEMAAFKISSLQKALDESVPQTELELANKQYTELTEKYRDMLERENALVARTERAENIADENKCLLSEMDTLKKELQMEKEKLHTLEQAMEQFTKAGMLPGDKVSKTVTNNEIISISKRLTMLEMKELNERQRAEHAVTMQTQLKNTVSQLEQRNLELETKFAELTKMNLEAQRVERELRDELANSVTKAASDADRNKIAQLEESEATLKVENSRLKEMAEVGASQARALEAQQQSREKEVASLRQQLLDIQSESDEKTVIGKLHHHIVALQVSEGTAVRKLEDATSRISKIEALVLRLEQKLDEKEQALYHAKVEGRNRARHLKTTVQELRRQFSGALPLAKQEKFAQNLLRLQEDQVKTQQELKQAREDRRTAEDNLAGLQLQHKGLEELIATLKDRKGAQKVAEWHAKMGEIRLQDLKLNRDVTRLKEQAVFLENLVAQHERSISLLEEESVMTARRHEDRQIQWEQRETELERLVDRMERQQNMVLDAAVKFEEATGSMPDPTLPVANQLEHAIHIIKQHIRTILETKQEADRQKQKASELEDQLKQAEANMISRDKVINELRLRLPASEARDRIISEAGTREEDYETKQAFKAAQQTITSLQARLAQKEESIQKYQELLKQQRESQQEEYSKHEEEIRLLQDKLQDKDEKLHVNFKQQAQERINQPGTAVPTNRDLQRLQHLEEEVAEHQNAMAAQSEKLKAARKEAERWKQLLQQKTREMQKKLDLLKEERAAEVNKLNRELDEHRQRISDLQKELAVVQSELDAQKEANTRAPTTTMKNLVERLKNQLALKEKQHKALSKALMELRADMVSTAQESVKAHAVEAEKDINVQKIVDRKTKELQDRVEELQGRLDALKKDVKKRKTRENALNQEVNEVKEDLAKKETALKKAKADRDKLESEAEELRGKSKRLSVKNQKAVDLDAKQTEVEELKAKVKSLQDQLQREKERPGRPATARRDDKNPAEELAKWEEGKKWQRRVDALKQKLSEKEGENDKLQKQVSTLRDINSRIDKDRSSLQKQTRGKGGELYTPRDPSLDQLKQKNYELEDEVASLRRQLVENPDPKLEEVMMRNRYLHGRVESLERDMAARRSAEIPGVSTDNRGDEEMRRRVLQLTEENMELKIEAEQAKRDVPRLKDRVEDLQKYIDVLKQERSDLQRKIDGNSRGSLSGRSGKSVPELEKTIGLMKKVVERVQKENEELKRAPGVVSNSRITDLEMENDKLRDQLEKLRIQMGGTLSMRYESSQKGMQKIMADYERLRSDLKKERDESEKVRLAKRNLELQNEKLGKELDDTKQRLTLVETKGPQLEGMDSKSWKSIVVTRMYESKMKEKEEELMKKNQLLQDVKVLLREAAEREQQLVHERDDLQEKLDILERFPVGSDKAPDIFRELQQTRLKCERLESEKAELVHDLQVMRRQQNPMAGGRDDVHTDDMLEKLRNYDKLMEENIEQSTQIKSLQLEKDRQERETEKLRGELANFDPAFFEEIEDLKYNYREAVKKNVMYEEQLRMLSRQFGVSVNIPDER
ncbi:centrosomal protein of 290 kDa-like [Branchiostoma lanceolatum]|uniref:centrosomal protein of 290 kDa-like n=1 Tax=Branchiostoma lanceolatum TaxID=7740 RepID=UPI003455D5A0